MRRENEGSAPRRRRPPELAYQTIHALHLAGRCNIGGRSVCVDGPVFTWKQLQELPPEL